MESGGILELCEEDVYALHFVFLPKIQQQLDNFRKGWCQHRLRTEGNKSPHQLWVLGQSMTSDPSVTNLDVSYTHHTLFLVIHA